MEGVWGGWFEPRILSAMRQWLGQREGRLRALWFGRLKLILSPEKGKGEETEGEEERESGELLVNKVHFPRLWFIEINIGAITFI